MLLFRHKVGHKCDRRPFPALPDPVADRSIRHLGPLLATLEHPLSNSQPVLFLPNDTQSPVNPTQKDIILGAAVQHNVHGFARSGLLHMAQHRLRTSLAPPRFHMRRFFGGPGSFLCDFPVHVPDFLRLCGASELDQLPGRPRRRALGTAVKSECILRAGLQPIEEGHPDRIQGRVARGRDQRLTDLILIEII